MNGIWVRSQDRNGPCLILGFWLEHDFNDHGKEAWIIKGYINDSISAVLGAYPTEQRALEVLSSLQDFIENGSLYEDANTHTLRPAVYQMDAE